jgi:hypothetical protein
MAVPIVQFNSSTGSETQASGAGPATAKFGTNASFAGSVVTLDGSPDLSGVAVDSSHVLWMLTSTGRQFFAITAKANSGTPTAQVTVADAPAGTATGRTWAIGGKRQSIDTANSRLLFTADVKPGWTIDLEGTFVLTSVITLGVSSTATGNITVQCSVATRAIITSATSSQILFNTGARDGWIWRHLKFTHTGGTRGDGFVANAVTGWWWWDDCVFDGLRKGINGDYVSNYTFVYTRVTRCEFLNCTSYAIEQAGGNFNLDSCYIHDNASHGFYGEAIAPVPFHSRTFTNCVIVNNGGRGIYWNLNNTNNIEFVIKNCIIANNTSNGIQIVGTTAFTRILTLINSIVYGNAAQVVVNDATAIVGYNNALHTTSPRSGYTSLPGEFTLAASPFIGGSDYRLNNTAGAGALCRAAGIPGPMGSMTGFLDIGALQTGGSSGSATRSYGA